MCYDFKFLGDNYYTTGDRRVKFDAEEDHRRTYTVYVDYFFLWDNSYKINDGKNLGV